MLSYTWLIIPILSFIIPAVNDYRKYKKIDFFKPIVCSIFVATAVFFFSILAVSINIGTKETSEQVKPNSKAKLVAVITDGDTVSEGIAFKDSKVVYTINNKKFSNKVDDYKVYITTSKGQGLFVPLEMKEVDVTIPIK